MTKTEVLLMALQKGWKMSEVKEFFDLLSPEEGQEIKAENETLKAENEKAKADLKMAQADNIRGDSTKPEPEQELTLKDLL